MVDKEKLELEPGKIPEPYIDLLIEAVRFRKSDGAVQEAITEYLHNGGPLEHLVAPKRSYASLQRAMNRIKQCHDRFCRAKAILDEW